MIAVHKLNHTGTHMKPTIYCNGNGKPRPRWIAVPSWEDVTCKKCLKHKGEIDNAKIIAQKEE